MQDKVSIESNLKSNPAYILITGMKSGIVQDIRHIRISAHIFVGTVTERPSGGDRNS
jgi:hypothetical protein